MGRCVALMLACALGACAAAPRAAAPAAERPYRILGRYAEAPDGALSFAWPASGVEGRFRGAHLAVTIEDNGENLMDVTVNGLTTTLDLEPGVHDYDIVGTRGVRDNSFRLTRKSEIYDSGITTIRALAAGGAWLAPPAYAHRMLVLGDSFSVGFGAGGPDEHCPYSAETGEPLRAYASLIAEAFNAELHLIAISGRGVIRNWDDSDPPRMPWQIDKALPDQDAPLWDQSRFQPELVIVHLGTNDFSQGYPGQRFDDGYAAMLRSLRAAYPQARIVAAFGPGEKEGADEAIQRAAATFAAEDGAPVPFAHLDFAEHAWGCSYHPSLASHEVMAAELIALIERELGWTQAR